MINNRRIHLISLVLAATLVVLTTVSAGALAGEIYADTEGITALSTDTVRVPVVISDANNLVAYQFIIGVGDTDTAKIEVDTSTLASGVSVSSAGIVMSTTNPSGIVPITGKFTVCELLVTPKSDSSVTIPISNACTYEGSYANSVPYTTRSSTLTVTGPGSDQVIEDDQGGSTVSDGDTDDDGTFDTGSKKGVSSISVPDHPNEPVVVKKNSAGIAEIPEEVEWISTDEVYTSATGGQLIQVTLIVSEDQLAKTGATKDDLFVIHSVLENGKTVWYQLPIVKTSVEDGYVSLTVDAWSAGTYVLAYDAGGLTFPMEESSTTYEPEVASPVSTTAPVTVTSSGAATTKPSTSSTGSSPLGFGIVAGLIAAVGGFVVIGKRRF